MKKAFLCALFIVLLSACVVPQAAKTCYISVKNKVMGNYYLDKMKYKQGIEALEREVKNEPESGEAHYYLGRCYLAENHSKDALVHLKKASTLTPDKADCHFWLGVAYAINDESSLERRSYLRALDLDPEHTQAMTYLGHNQLQKGEYEAALRTYEKALHLSPGQPSPLYNRALILDRLGRTSEEREAWKRYLATCSSGPMARQAVDHLNAIGDFEYRNHLIGSRMITLERIRFEPRSPTLSNRSYGSLHLLGEVMRNNERVIVHILAYQNNNEKLAELRAGRVKVYLLEHYPEIEPSRLVLSWFGVSEEIKVEKKSFRENESIRFITAVKSPNEK